MQLLYYTTAINSNMNVISMWYAPIVSERAYKKNIRFPGNLKEKTGRPLHWEQADGGGKIMRLKTKLSEWINEPVTISEEELQEKLITQYESYTTRDQYGHWYEDVTEYTLYKTDSGLVIEEWSYSRNDQYEGRYNESFEYWTLRQGFHGFYIFENGDNSFYLIHEIKGIVEELSNVDINYEGLKKYIREKSRILFKEEIPEDIPEIISFNFWTCNPKLNNNAKHPTIVEKYQSGNGFWYEKIEYPEEFEEYGIIWKLLKVEKMSQSINIYYYNKNSNIAKLIK